VDITLQLGFTFEIGSTGFVHCIVGHSHVIKLTEYRNIVECEEEFV
jgi:hypothetical protein